MFLVIKKKKTVNHHITFMSVVFETLTFSNTDCGSKVRSEFGGFAIPITLQFSRVKRQAMRTCGITSFIAAFTNLPLERLG